IRDLIVTRVQTCALPISDDNKATAISFAAYRCLRNLYPDAASKVRLDVALAAALASSRYDPNNASNVTAAVIGNIAAHAVIDARSEERRVGKGGRGRGWR